MKKATDWARHLIEMVARRTGTDKLSCSRKLYRLIEIAVGYRKYELGDLVEVTALLTGVSTAQAQVLDGPVAAESQIAIHAHRVALNIQAFEKAYQTKKSASGRFSRFLRGEQKEESGIGEKLLESFYYLCDYLAVDRPDIPPEEVKPFLEAVAVNMPRPGSAEQPAS